MAAPAFDPLVRAAGRFGLGLRADMPDADRAAMARDPRGALLAELDAPDPDGPDLRPSWEAGLTFRETQQDRQDARLAQARARALADSQGQPDPMLVQGPNRPEMQGPPPPPVNGVNEIVRAELADRQRRALTAPLGFKERLVRFWSNHFAVSMDKGGPVRAMAGPYEREAIRAHVAGRFADMLMAVARHPAMILYLDNARSMGPNSLAGQRQNRGLNENLAREILELHTLGVRSVYSQGDVTRFAAVITGWTMWSGQEPDEVAFRFRFFDRMHEPGPKVVLGKTYPEGEEGGARVLADLARHPATATRVATRLAQHFVADEAPPALVSRLEATFKSSGGDLKAVARALVVAHEAFDTPPTKLRAPIEWVLASLRGLAVDMPAERAERMTTILGQPTWRVPSPKGWPDEAGPWRDGLGQRLDVATLLSRSAGGQGSPEPLAEKVLGVSMRPETREAIRRAETRQMGLALMLMSPDMQRR